MGTLRAEARRVGFGGLLEWVSLVLGIPLFVEVDSEVSVSKITVSYVVASVVCR